MAKCHTKWLQDIDSLVYLSILYLKNVIFRTSELQCPGARIRINMVYLGTLPKVACNVKNAFAVSFVVEVKNICCFGSNSNVQGCHKIGAIYQTYHNNPKYSDREVLVKVTMTYISRSSDFALYLADHLIYEYHTLGL